jgi:hypothetical protein
MSTVLLHTAWHSAMHCNHIVWSKGKEYLSLMMMMQNSAS